MFSVNEFNEFTVVMICSDEAHLIEADMDEEHVAVMDAEGHTTTIQYATQGPNGEIFLPIQGSK